MCLVSLAATGENRVVPDAFVLDAALERVASDPVFRPCFTAEGRLRPSVRILLNDELVDGGELDKVNVGEEDEVLLIHVFAGG